MDSCSLLILILFGLRCLGDARTNKLLWRLIFNALENFDSKLEERRNISEKSVVKTFITFLLVNIFLACSLMPLNIEEAIIYAVLIATFYLYLIHTQLFVTTFVSTNVLNTIGRRFEIFIDKTGQAYMDTHIEQVFCNGLQLKHSHYSLIIITKSFNKIFGQRILLLVVLTFFYILNSFQYITLEDLPIDSIIVLIIALKVFCLLVSSFMHTGKIFIKQVRDM